MRGKSWRRRWTECEIFARLDFDFDALVAGGEFLSHGSGEFLERIFDSDGNSAGNFLRVPPINFQSGTPFGLASASQMAVSSVAFAMLCPRTCSRSSQTSAAEANSLPLRQRPKKIFEDVPGGFGVFGQ